MHPGHTQDNDMNNDKNIIRNDFTDSASCFVTMAARMAGVSLRDRTVEAGHYSRLAYETSQDGWDKIHTVMTAARSVATGTEKRVLTAAISRIRTSASIAAEKAALELWLSLSQEERDIRKAARREARRQARLSNRRA